MAILHDLVDCAGKIPSRHKNWLDARPHYECCEQTLRGDLRKVRHKAEVSDLYLCCLCSSVAARLLLADAAAVPQHAA